MKPIFPRGIFTIGGWVAPLAGVSVFLLAGCSSTRHLEYGEFVRPLDGKSELAVSTYPAWFPETVKKTEISETLITDDQLNFQIHVRDAAAKVGKNHHVQSIRIHRFSYQLPGESVVELLKDYEASFWMQGNPAYDQINRPPIPYIKDGAVNIDIKLTLNGTDHAFSGEMKAHEFTRRNVGQPSRIGH